MEFIAFSLVRLAASVAAGLTDPVVWLLIFICGWIGVGLGKLRWALLAGAAMAALTIAVNYSWWQSANLNTEALITRAMASRIFIALIAYGLGRLIARTIATTQ